MKNSFGTGWGGSGYMELARGSNRLGVGNFAYGLQSGSASAGACALPDGSCDEMTSDDCSAASGSFGGVGTFCETACVAPSPTPTDTPTDTPSVTPTATPTGTPVSQGGVCAIPSQCATGFCVDGVCCDSACTGPLQKCNPPGQGGTCASAAAPAPALSLWGLLAAAALLASVAAFALRHRLLIPLCQMSYRSRTIVAIGVLLHALAGSAGASPTAYVLNQEGTLSVIDAATNAVTTPDITFLEGPQAIASSPDGTRIYVSSGVSGELGIVWQIDTATNTLGGHAVVGHGPAAIAVAPDGERVYVSNMFDGTLSVVDTRTLASEMPPISLAPPGLDSYPGGVAVTSSGGYAYVVDTLVANVIEETSRTVVAVVDLQTRNVLQDLPLLPYATGIGFPLGIVLSPDSERAVVVGSVIDIPTNKLNPFPGTPIAMAGGNYAVAFSPDSAVTYVVGGAGGKISLYSLTSATYTLTRPPLPLAPDFPQGEGQVAIAVSPDGTRLYVTISPQERVFVIDTTANALSGLPIPVGAEPIAIALAAVQPPLPSPTATATPPAKRARTGPAVYVLNAGDGSLSVIDTATNLVVTPPVFFDQLPRAIAGSPDGTRIYVATVGIGEAEAGKLWVIDTATNALLQDPLPLGLSPTAIAITPDGRRAYITNDNDATISIVDTQTNTLASRIVLGQPEFGSGATSIVISSDGKRGYFIDDGDNEVLAVDLSTNAISGGWANFPCPTGLAVTPDGNRVYVFNADSESVSVIDVPTGAVNTLPGTPIPLAASAAVFSPDGSRMYVEDGTSLYSLDTATNTLDRPPLSWAEGSNPFAPTLISAVAISPDGRRLYVSDTSDRVSVIDTAASAIVGSPIAAGVEPIAMAVVERRATSSTAVGQAPGNCAIVPGSEPSDTLVIVLIGATGIAIRRRVRLKETISNTRCGAAQSA